MQYYPKTPRILITGGLGHIGSCLVRFLGGRITVVDNLLTQRYCSLFDSYGFGSSTFTFWNKDFADLAVSELAQFDIVIHLAAITDAANSFKNKAEIERINVAATKDFISKCSEADLKLFIFPSSTSVYGSGDAIMTEDNPGCINPQSPYADAKMEIENTLRDTELRHIILRFGTIYGVSLGMRFHTAINKFCFQACTGVPLTIWKQNYDQKRPYLDLHDAVRVMRFIIDRCRVDDYSVHHPCTLLLNQTYNVLTDNHTLSEVVEIVKSMVHVELDMVDTPLLNQHSYEVSCDRITNLGFRFKGLLREGIEATMELLSPIRSA